MISITWKTTSKKCWTELNGSKRDVLLSLKECIENCWSKYDFGSDATINDCFTVILFSKDENIKKSDIENLKEYAKSYFDEFRANTPYRLKIRYNYTGSEVSIVNYGFCGNNIVEQNEFCDGNSYNCISQNQFGECTDSSTLCEDCKCVFLINCTKCIHTKPRGGNTNTDWCNYCKPPIETDCNDGYDDDCDGKVDGYDDECKEIMVFRCGSGTAGCPNNHCLTNKEKNGTPYPPCPANIKILGTNPANPSSCDSPKCMYDFIHDPNMPYIDVYDLSKREELKKEIESQLVTIDFLNFKITVNKKVAPKFIEVNEKLNKYPHNGNKYIFPSGEYTFLYVGSYVFRQNVNNPTVLSPHAFGLAIDLNYQQNWGNVLDDDPCNQPSCIMDIPPEVVEAFESSGFRWGGRFWCRFDPMHFEYIPSCIEN